MADLASDIVSALQAGARAGASAASTAGRDLSGDIERFLLPQLQGIGIQVADILAKQQSGDYSNLAAQTMLAGQCDDLKSAIETVTTLAVAEVQQIYTAILGALTGAVNKAAGIALL